MPRTNPKRVSSRRTRDFSSEAEQLEVRIDSDSSGLMLDAELIERLSYAAVLPFPNRTWRSRFRGSVTIFRVSHAAWCSLLHVSVEEREHVLM